MPESPPTPPGPALIPQLKDVLTELTKHPFPFLPSPPDLQKRASVTLILRVKPHYSHWPAESGSQSIVLESSSSDSRADTLRSIDAFFAQDWVQHGEPEALFIKRATRVGSENWNGHVALPGGGREPEDVDDRATSVRETLEEVGIELSAQNAIAVGNLPQRLVTSSWGKRPLMVLCPYVFLLRRHDIPPLKLQPSEVAGAHWVPLRELLDSRSRTFEWQDVSGRLANQKKQWSLRRLYYRFTLGHMLFSAVQLKPSESVLSTTAGSHPGILEPSGILKSARTWFAETTGYRPALENPLLLWGLTLGVMADFLELLPPHNALQLWHYPTFSSLDVRFFLWLLSWRFRRNKHLAMKNFPATVPASIELGLDSVPMPCRDEAWIKDNPPCSGEAGLGINSYEGPHFKRKRRGSRSSRVGFMLEGYYDLIGRGVVLCLFLRSSLLVVLAVMALRRFRRWRSR